MSFFFISKLTDLQWVPGGNQDLRRNGNCKWEAALAKLTIDADECNWYSYRSETDRWRWEPSCQLLHCDVEGKEKPPYYDLKKQQPKYYDES